MTLLVGMLVLSSMAGPDVSTARPPDQSRRMRIEMVDTEIRNPWLGRPDRVRLRAYRGEGIGPDDLVAPTLRVRPGERLDLHVDNRLPACVEGEKCFNGTNIHTHGLWISPSGNSDNVMLDIRPGSSFDWRFDIPEEHPAGTFWYHPHAHGNTFVQVGSGMAGALIVEGDRLPTATTPGDVDVLLHDEDSAFRERIFVFQQIHYACFDEKGAIKAPLDEEGFPTAPWTCDEGDVGEIRAPDQDGIWPSTGRFTSINGVVQPTLESGVVGRFERWRMIHAGVRERVLVEIRKLADDAPALATVSGDGQRSYVSSYCRGEPLPMWQVSIDGLTRTEVRPATEAPLWGGTRTDYVTRFPEAGRYCVVHADRGDNHPQNSARVLALVDIADGPASTGDATEALRQTLIASAKRAMAGSDKTEVRDQVVADLRDGMKLSSFVWHKPIRRNEVTGIREATVNILESHDDVRFHINGRPFSHERIDEYLPLGAVEQWHVASLIADHPLHIHVNPFQLVGVRDGLNRDVINPESPGYDPDYAGLQGQWMDTILLKMGHRALFRTRYERFTGDFVTHCHIMAHGDNGMMMHLRIYDPADGDRTAAQEHAAMTH